MTDEQKKASKWEECAQHVEAGGVVQWLHSDGNWRDERLGIDGLCGGCLTRYRRRTDAPGKGGYRSRRLMPFAAPNPEGMTPGPEVDGRPTWYGTARDAEVAGMTETRGWTNGEWIPVGNLDAVSIVQARYPLPPKPRTVRVHWSEAVDREDPHDGVIWVAQKFAGSEPRVYFTGGGWMDVESADGTVEVLVEDGES